MTREEILDRLRKMKQLADRGVGGERENAERQLAEIAAQYGIDLVTQWCKDIADHLHDLSNDLVEGFNVEIEDLELFGGLHITCADQDNKEPYELWILPIKKGEQE